MSIEQKNLKKATEIGAEEAIEGLLRQIAHLGHLRISLRQEADDGR